MHGVTACRFLPQLKITSALPEKRHHSEKQRHMFTQSKMTGKKRRQSTPVTAKTPPTTAQNLTRRCAKDCLVSVMVTEMGEMSYMKSTAGICISPLCTIVSYSVTEY